MNSIIKTCFSVMMLNISSVKMTDINGDKVIPQLLVSDDFGSDYTFNPLKHAVTKCIRQDLKGYIPIFHYLRNGFKINGKDFKIDSNLASIIFNFSHFKDEVKDAVDICEVSILMTLNNYLYAKPNSHAYGRERKLLRLNKLYDDLGSIKSLTIDGDASYCEYLCELYLSFKGNIFSYLKPYLFMNITSSGKCYKYEDKILYKTINLFSDIIHINSKEKCNITSKTASYIVNLKGNYDSIKLNAKYVILDNVTCNTLSVCSPTQFIVRNSRAKECLYSDYKYYICPAYIDNSSNAAYMNNRRKTLYGNDKIISDEKINKCIYQLSNINFAELQNSIDDYLKNIRNSYKEFRDDCDACLSEIKFAITNLNREMSNLEIKNMYTDLYYISLERQKKCFKESKKCLNYIESWFDNVRMYEHKYINEEMILEDFGSITMKNILG